MIGLAEVASRIECCRSRGLGLMMEEDPGRRGGLGVISQELRSIRGYSNTIIGVYKVSLNSVVVVVVVGVPRTSSRHHCGHFAMKGSEIALYI